NRHGLEVLRLHYSEARRRAVGLPTRTCREKEEKLFEVEPGEVDVTALRKCTEFAEPAHVPASACAVPSSAMAAVMLLICLWRLDVAVWRFEICAWSASIWAFTAG